MWTNWISFLIGLWIFFSGLVPQLRAEWNLIIFGILAVLFGFASYKNWQGIINGIGGVWLFLSGIWFVLMAPANFVITGIIMAPRSTCRPQETSPRTRPYRRAPRPSGSA